MMDDLEELVERGEGVNFIPCVKWVQRGAAKSVPEKVKLTQEELSAVIEKTQRQLNVAEEEEVEENEEKGDDDDEVIEEGSDNDQDIVQKYDLDNYDNEDENTSNQDLGNLISHANPRDDPYLVNPDLEDDQSDIEDYTIKDSDNLLLVGHVDGNAAVLEVYVYNDDEDALYVHHDLILPSYPMALEWLSFDPSESSSKGNLVAVGSMSPIIDVWDVDVIDCLEPAFSLGQKGSKKKKVARVGHRDAVLSLAWNAGVGHLLASGSVDQSVLLWDLRQGSVARTLKGHAEKVQALDWHPFESHVLLTGCCDEIARVYDCNSGTCKSWKVQGEVEKVLWNRFNPFQFLVATEQGYVHMVDARQDGKHLWTLSAHSEGINGISMSSQCPGLLLTGSSDKTVKVWDINNQPSCLMEKDLKVGMVHSVHNCPDAPFVFAVGGDNPSHNMHVMDVRESSAVVERFSSVKLVADVKIETNDDQSMNSEEVSKGMEELSVGPSLGGASSGAVGKFKKKEKKKKNKKKF